MTDARIPDRWLSDRRLQRLTDAHFRAFITSLVWAVANRTDGVIEPEDLRLIPNFAPNAVQVFLDSGLWTCLGHGWLITDFMATQTSRAQLEAAEIARAKEREKKAKQRAAKRDAASTNDVAPWDVPRDVPTDDTGQDRPGKDRPGDETEQITPSLADLNIERMLTPNTPSPAARPRWRGAGPDPFEEYR